MAELCQTGGKKLVQYKSKKGIILLLDLRGIVLSFLLSVGIRYGLLVGKLGSNLDKRLYLTFFCGAVVLYLLLSLICRNEPIEKLSVREIVVKTVEQQILFIAAYIILFYLFPQTFVVSRAVVGLFFVFNIAFCSLFRILYRTYCVKRIREVEKVEPKKARHTDTQHVYIIGSKSIGLYGGYETFLMNLLQQHGKNKHLKYHIA